MEYVAFAKKIFHVALSDASPVLPMSALCLYFMLGMLADDDGFVNAPRKARRRILSKKNAAYLGRGVCYNKFTGSRGKSGSNDANAEFIGKVRRIMDDNKVCWQTAELGRVDLGGGGTIAYICALYGMEVIDSGVAVLNMHAPMEIISKADLYEAAKAYKAFMLNA